MFDLEERGRQIAGRAALGYDLTVDERALLLALDGHGVSPPPAGEVEGLSEAERQGDPSLAVGLTWRERVALYEARCVVDVGDDG